MKKKEKRKKKKKKKKRKEIRDLSPSFIDHSFNLLFYLSPALVSRQESEHKQKKNMIKKEKKRKILEKIVGS